MVARDELAGELHKKKDGLLVLKVSLEAVARERDRLLREVAILM